MAADDLWILTFAERWSEIAKEYGMRGCKPDACRVDPQRRRRILMCRDLEDDMAVWANGFRAVGENTWNTGENPRGWRANMDYILRDKNRCNIMEMGHERMERAEWEAKKQAERQAEADSQHDEAQKKMERGEW